MNVCVCDRCGCQLSWHLLPDMKLYLACLIDSRQGHNGSEEYHLCAPCQWIVEKALRDVLPGVRIEQ